MIMIAINAYCENKIKLVLNDSCEFVSDQGKNFVVIEYPGKTAHEIFDGINTNIVKNYNSAKNVTNVVEDKTISVRAYTDNLIEFFWWKEPKKMTLGKVLLATVTCGANLLVDAVKTENLINGQYMVEGYYKFNIDIKDGKARLSMPIIDGINAIKIVKDEKTIDSNDWDFKDAVIINRDKAVSTRKGTKEKADEVNAKKELFLKECVKRIESIYNIIMTLPDDEW